MTRHATLPYLLELEAKCTRLEETISELNKETSRALDDSAKAKSTREADKAAAITMKRIRDGLQADIPMKMLTVGSLERKQMDLKEWTVDLDGRKARELEAEWKRGFDAGVLSCQPERTRQERDNKNLRQQIEATKQIAEEMVSRGNIKFEQEHDKVLELERKSKERDEENRAQKELIKSLVDEKDKLLTEKNELGQHLEDRNLQLKKRDELIKNLKETKSDQIESEAKLLFNKEKTRWESEHKPKEILDEASKLLAQIAESLDGGRYPLPDEVQPLRKRLLEIIVRNVKRTIDDDYKMRVEDAGRKRAEVIFQQESPRWLKDKIAPEITNLVEKITANVIRFLNARRWKVPCNQCNTLQPFEMTPERIAQLLSGGFWIQCVNPDCHNPWNLLGGFRYSFHVSLEYLISTYLTEGYDPGALYHSQ